MSLTHLSMAARQVAANITEAANAATDAAPAFAKAASAQEAAFQKAYESSAWKDLIDQYIQLIEMIKGAGAMGNRTLLAPMEDLINRVTKGIDFNYLKNRGISSGTKTSISFSSGSSVTSLSTAAAQGKMGW